jgi:hypothetical protein
VAQRRRLRKVDSMHKADGCTLACLGRRGVGGRARHPQQRQAGSGPARAAGAGDSDDGSARVRVTGPGLNVTVTRTVTVPRARVCPTPSRTVTGRRSRPSHGRRNLVVT